MCTNLINLTMKSIDIVEQVRSLTSYNLDFTFENDYMDNIVIRRKLKFYYRTEEILTLVLHLKNLENDIIITKIKAWFKNKESVCVPPKDLVIILKRYFREHNLSDYNLSNNCCIVTDKHFVMYRDNRTIENIKLNYDTNTNSKYFLVKYKGDNILRYSGYNSDFLKMYNKKFRDKNPKILNW